MPIGPGHNSGALMVLDPDGRILLLRQGYRGRKWTLPGGMANPAESPREAAVRETVEETGLQLDAGELVAVYHKRSGNRGLRFVFAADAPAGAPVRIDGGEIVDWGWFELDALPRRCTRVVRRLCRDLRRGSTDPYGEIG